jgi:hypothetical protein
MTREPVSRRADAYVRYHVLLSRPAQEYRASVLPANATIQPRGLYSAVNRQGWYVSRHTQSAYPQYVLDSWRSYSKGGNVHREVTLDATTDAGQRTRSHHLLSKRSFMLESLTAIFLCSLPAVFPGPAVQ